MKAALLFVEEIRRKNFLNRLNAIKIDLYGSLALTKTGHGTDVALQLGLCGFSPKNIDTSRINEIIRNIRTSGKIKILGEKTIGFTNAKDIKVHKSKELPHHPNGLIITAVDTAGKVIHSEEYYSVGGGFVETKDEIAKKNDSCPNSRNKCPNNFNNWNDLVDCCTRKHREIWEIVLENELALQSNRKEINKNINEIRKVMKDCIKSGLGKKGNLKGGLSLKRRSLRLFKTLKNKKVDHLEAIDSLLLGGMAASEENASYGRIVSAPTNGAAGVIPAVARYYEEFYDPTVADFRKFILTAGAIGIICKKNATISGAEGGCQAEIGVATAMAATGLCAALGGTIKQCENAAIIALTHNLGLVCDPIRGLVQIPCIERNPMNAIKAVAACRLALLENESVYLKLDRVICSMKEIGDNMPSIYKETALGGLAKNARNSRQKKTIIRKFPRLNRCGDCFECGMSG
jgi:L-serine dehydratase